MEIKDIKKIHFIGIGGIGMSALAQFFAHSGVAVSGSDREESPTTKLLESKGVHVTLGHNAKNVTEGIDAVVYTDAIPKDNPELIEAEKLGISGFSYFQMLGKVSKKKRTIAVAGTHGKTTTTGMLAKILIDADASPTVIVGSIVKDFGSNYVAGKSDIFVVEACEYRDHLLELSPEVLVITNLEWDHTDYFPSLPALQETFRKAISKVPPHGAVVTNPSNPNIAPLLSSSVASIVDYTKETIPELKMLGGFNEMNARAASKTAQIIMPEINDTVITNALSDFQGTWRRFEYKGKTKNGADVYDDYAHHPTAVYETIKALRAKVTGKIFVAFHPHLFSRTRDLLDDFANAFVGADDVVIAPIYAAREKDDGTISNRILAERISETGTHARAIDSFDDIEMFLEQHAQSGDTIMTMGAGDIYKVSEALTNR